jgi:hypothetical protein
MHWSIFAALGPLLLFCLLTVVLVQVVRRMCRKSIRAILADQAVVVTFDYGGPDLADLLNLENRLAEALDEIGGECDGHVMSGDLRQGTLHLFGGDAEAILAAVREILESEDCIRNPVATLRFGLPGYGPPERVVRLTPEE